MLLALPALATRSGTIFTTPTSGDPMSVYWNPAAMTLARGTSSLLMSGISFFGIEYQRADPSPATGLPYAPVEFNAISPSPSFGIVTDAGLDDFRFGLCVTSPLYAGIRWPDYQDNGMPSSTRYHIIQGFSIPLTIGTAAAYRINKYISVGAGLDILAFWVEQEAMIDMGAKLNQISCRSLGGPCQVNSPLAREDPAFAARSTLDGIGWGAGAYFGVLVTPLSWLKLGLTVHTGNTVNVPLSVNVEMPQAVQDYVSRNLPSITLPVVETEADAGMVWPTTVTAGLTVSLLDKRLDLSAYLHWANTSTGSTLLADVSSASSAVVPSTVELVRAAEDQFVYHFLGVYQLLPNLKLAALLEILLSNRPESFVSPATLALTTFMPALGVSWAITHYLTASLEYSHYFPISRTVRISRFAPNADPTTPVEEGLDKPSATGRYGGPTDRLAIGVQVNF
jgi:long-subunit fatty acid transport protein